MAGDAFARNGALEDIFEKMAKMEMEKHEKMMQLENEKLQLALRNISLEHTVYSLRWENKEQDLTKKAQDGAVGVENLPDGHPAGSGKKVEKSTSVNDNVIPFTFISLID